MTIKQIRAIDRNRLKWRILGVSQFTYFNPDSITKDEKVIFKQMHELREKLLSVWDSNSKELSNKNWNT